MTRWGIAIVGAIGAVAIGAAMGMLIAWLQRPRDQFVQLTTKRYAELLELQRRQHEQE